MEILEAYCRTVLVAAQLGKPPNTFTPAQLKDLLNIKQKLDIPDRRIGLKECELCDNDEWRPGVSCAATAAESAGSNGADSEAEQIVQTVTDMIMERMKH
jgi:L-fuculose-phosphate aldolase